MMAATAAVVLVALGRWWPRWVEKYRVRHERIRIQAEAQRRVWLESRKARYRPVPPEQVRRGWIVFGVAVAGGTGLLAALAWWWLRTPPRQQPPQPHSSSGPASPAGADPPQEP